MLLGCVQQRHGAMANTYLAQQSLDFEASAINLQVGRFWKTAHTVCESVDKVEEVIRHGASCGEVSLCLSRTWSLEIRFEFTTQ